MKRPACEVSHLAIISLLLPLVIVCGTRAWAYQADSSEATAAAAKSKPDKKKSRGGSSVASAWAPPEVRETVDAVGGDAECSLKRVLPLVSERVKEFVSNLPEFTATERLEHQQLTNAGTWGTAEVKLFQYVAEIREIQPGILSAEEYRDGSRSLNLFPAGLADLGLPALVLVFHPYFLGDNSITCEEFGNWQGTPAWQLYFEQRPERAPRLQGFNTKMGWFPLQLKGRAWVAADTHEVIHLETDLMYPVPQIRLLREHVAVDYRPVRFPKHKVELWLPETAEVYMDFRGRRYRRRHTFSDFLLFSVDVKQQIAEPKAPKSD